MPIHIATNLVDALTLIHNHPHARIAAIKGNVGITVNTTAGIWTALESKDQRNARHAQVAIALDQLVTEYRKTATTEDPLYEFGHRTEERYFITTLKPNLFLQNGTVLRGVSTDSQLKRYEAFLAKYIASGRNAEKLAGFSLSQEGLNGFKTVCEPGQEPVTGQDSITGLVDVYEELPVKLPRARSTTEVNQVPLYASVQTGAAASAASTIVSKTPAIVGNYAQIDFNHAKSKVNALETYVASQGQYQDLDAPQAAALPNSPVREKSPVAVARNAVEDVYAVVQKGTKAVEAATYATQFPLTAAERVRSDALGKQFRILYGQMEKEITNLAALFSKKKEKVKEYNATEVKANALAAEVVELRKQIVVFDGVKNDLIEEYFLANQLTEQELRRTDKQGVRLQKLFHDLTWQLTQIKEQSSNSNAGAAMQQLRTATIETVEQIRLLREESKKALQALQAQRETIKGKLHTLNAVDITLLKAAQLDFHKASIKGLEEILDRVNADIRHFKPVPVPKPAVVKTLSNGDNAVALNDGSIPLEAIALPPVAPPRKKSKEAVTIPVAKPVAAPRTHKVNPELLTEALAQSKYQLDVLFRLQSDLSLSDELGTKAYAPNDARIATDLEKAAKTLESTTLSDEQKEQFETQVQPLLINYFAKHDLLVQAALNHHVEQLHTNELLAYQTKQQVGTSVGKENARTALETASLAKAKLINKDIKVLAEKQLVVVKKLIAHLSAQTAKTVVQTLVQDLKNQLVNAQAKRLEEVQRRDDSFGKAVNKAGKIVKVIEYREFSSSFKMVQLSELKEAYLYNLIANLEKSTALA